MCKTKHIKLVVCQKCETTIYFIVIDPSIHFSKNRLASLIKSLQTINILVDHLNSGNVCNQYSCLWGPYVSCKWGASKNGSNLSYLKLIIGYLKALKVKDYIYRAISSHHKEMALWPLSHLSVNPYHCRIKW